MTESEQFKQSLRGRWEGYRMPQARKSLLDMFKILKNLSVGWLLEWTPGRLYYGMVQKQQP